MRRRLSCSELSGDESGQALVYVALIMAVIVAALLALFDLGRLTGAKIQAQNAADAAALAAASVKVSVHHTRELAYLAMTDQGVRARLELLGALASFSDEREFQDHVRKAGIHLGRIQKLKTDLAEYNDWIDTAGPEIVADAARLAYAANIQGMNDHLTTAKGLELENLRALDAPNALRENSDQGQELGGVNYPSEGLGAHNVAGKSYVEVVPKYQGFDWSFFGSGSRDPVEVPAWAAAGFAPSTGIALDPAAKGAEQPLKLGGIGLNWYSPRLVRTGQKSDGNFGGSSWGGGIESEH